MWEFYFIVIRRVFIKRLNNNCCWRYKKNEFLYMVVKLWIKLVIIEISVDVFKKVEIRKVIWFRIFISGLWLKELKIVFYRDINFFVLIIVVSYVFSLGSYK